MTVLDLNGTSARVAYRDPAEPLLSTLRVGTNPSVTDASVPMLLRLFPRLRSLDLRDIPRWATATNDTARREVLASVEPRDASRTDVEAGSLTCPQWVGRDTGLRLTTDAPFLNYSRCRCVDGNAWDWSTGRCVACSDRVSVAGGRPVLSCDPFVQNAHHVLDNGWFPMMTDGSAASDATSVLLSRPVACHLHGVCVGSSSGQSADPKDHESPGPSQFTFVCSGHRDESTPLCGGCESGYWHHGGSCVQCPSSRSLLWLVPFVMVVAMSCVFAYVWRKSGRVATWHGECQPDALSPLFLWFQLLSLFGSYSALASSGGGQNRSQLTWSFVSEARGYVQTAAVWDVSALRCVFGDGFGYGGVVICTMFGPPLFGALILFVLRLVGVSRVRSWYVAMYLWHSTLLPVVAASLSVMVCERPSDAADISYLVAAPEVRCGTRGHRWLVGLSVTVLVVYVLPLLLHAYSALRKLRDGGSLSSSSSLSSPHMSEPLLELESPSVIDDDTKPSGVTPVLSDAATASSLVYVRSLADASRVWYWPVLDVLRALVLSSLVSLSGPSSLVMPVGVSVVLMGSGLLTVQLRPRSPRDNVLWLLALVGSFLVFQIRVAVVHSHSTGASAFTSLVEIVVTLVLAACVVADVRRQ